MDPESEGLRRRRNDDDADPQQQAAQAQTYAAQATHQAAQAQRYAAEAQALSAQAQHQAAHAAAVQKAKEDHARVAAASAPAQRSDNEEERILQETLQRQLDEQQRQAAIQQVTDFRQQHGIQQLNPIDAEAENRRRLDALTRQAFEAIQGLAADQGLRGNPLIVVNREVRQEAAGPSFLEKMVGWIFSIGRSIFKRVLVAIHYVLMIIGFLLLIAGSQNLPELSSDYVKIFANLLLPSFLSSWLTAPDENYQYTPPADQGVNVRFGKDKTDAMGVLEMKAMVHVPLLLGIIFVLSGAIGIASVRGSRSAAAMSLGFVFLSIGIVSVMLDPLKDLEVLDKKLDKVKNMPGSTGHVELDPEQFFFFVFLKQSFQDFTKFATDSGCTFSGNRYIEDSIVCSTDDSGNLLGRTFQMLWSHAINSSDKTTTIAKVNDCVKNVRKFLDSNQSNRVMYCRTRVAMFGFLPYFKIFFLFLIFHYMMAGCLTSLSPYEKNIMHMWKHSRKDLVHFATFGVCMSTIILVKLTLLSEALIFEQAGL